MIVPIMLTVLSVTTALIVYARGRKIKRKPKKPKSRAS